jgi:uncharacterized protein (TIGR02302 family)
MNGSTQPRPSVLSPDQLQQPQPDLPAAGRLTLTRIILWLEIQYRHCWRFYCVLGSFLALAWLDLLPSMPDFLHFAVLAIFAVLALGALRGTRPAWRWPSLMRAARRLEQHNQLQHFPYEALTARVINDPHTPAIQSLWAAHQQRARQVLHGLRLPLPKFQIDGRDPFYLRLWILLLFLGAMIGGWGEIGQRTIRALDLKVSNTAAQVTGSKLTAWATPPAYTGLPPMLLLDAGRAPANLPAVLAVPRDSTLSFRLVGADDATLPVMLTDQDTQDFVAAAENNFTLTIPLPATKTLRVKQGWRTLAHWTISIIDDQSPQIAWTEPPQIKGNDVTLQYRASDDYGLQKLALQMELAISTRGVPQTMPEIILSGAGQKQQPNGKTSLPLGAHLWAGLPVRLKLLATDKIGQIGETTTIALTLPEHFFRQELARELAKARRELLSEPETSWRPTINLILTALADPARYRSDPSIFLGLRSLAARMYLDPQQKQLTAVATMLWQIALALDTGQTIDKLQALRQAQQALAEALANQADGATLNQRMAELQQAMAEYLQAMAQNLDQETSEIPEDILAEAAQDTANDLSQRLQEIEELAATGNRAAAEEKLRELQQMMEQLQQAKPMPAEKQAEIKALQELRKLTEAQEKLRDQTAQQEKSSETEAPDLSKPQSELRAELGKIVGDLAQQGAEPQPQLATADQGMKDAGENLAEQAWGPAKDAQDRSLQALRELNENLKQRLRQNLVVLPRGGGSSSSRQGESFNPFDRGDNDDNKGASAGEVKIPDQYERQRARDILDELRRRANESNRPSDERGYIERLLDLF